MNTTLNVGQSIPSGYVVGRLNGGVGPAGLISIAELGHQMSSTGYFVTPGSTAGDVVIGYNLLGTSDVDFINHTPAEPGTSNEGFALWQYISGSTYFAFMEMYTDSTFSELDLLQPSGAVGAFFYCDATMGQTGSIAAIPYGIAAQNVNVIVVYPGGGATVGTPTGGDMGVGSLNAQALYVNGVAVGGGSSTLAGDTDVNISAPANKNMLWYQTSDNKWHNTTLTAVLDSIFGSAQGDVLYRDASAWAALTPGTSGQFLKTQGAGANPIWATPSGGSAANGMLPLVNGDLPGPSPIADGSGQYIGVPL